MDIVFVYILIIIASVLINSGALYLAAKVTKNETDYRILLLISVIFSLICILPYGSLIGIIVLFVLLYKWAQMEFWPDAVLTVVVAWAMLVGVRVAMLALLMTPH